MAVAINYLMNCSVEFALSKNNQDHFRRVLGMYCFAKTTRNTSCLFQAIYYAISNKDIKCAKYGPNLIIFEAWQVFGTKHNISTSLWVFLCLIRKTANYYS